MSILRSKAYEIVTQSNLLKRQYRELLAHHFTEADIERQASVVQARQTISTLRRSIINEYQVEIFNGIQALLECEWRKQQYEATKM